MKFIDYSGKRYISYADLVNWLAHFAADIEDGYYDGSGTREAEIVWNIISDLMERDIRNRSA